jgi:hypothetical protein
VLVLAMLFKFNPRFKGGTQRKEQRSGDRACDSDGGALASVVPVTRVQESKEKDPGENHKTPMIV